jgi:heptosyltransferase-1
MKIAIVKLSALGDIVHAMVALQFIKQASPDIVIDWLVEESFAGVLQSNPDINQVLTVNLKALKKDKRLFFIQLNKIKQYATNHYDLVIDAQGLIKSAIVARLLSKNTAGFNKQSIREKLATHLYKTTVDSPYDANTIDRNVAVIGQPLGINISEQQILNKSPFLFSLNPNNIDRYFVIDKPNILFVIGSTWLSRNYPKEQYLHVLARLDANNIIIWGNEQEHEEAKWIANRTTNAVIIPRMDFNDLKHAINQADLIIGNDTGPTHMAWGLNKPSITLFGPTPVSRVYQTSINKVLKSPSKVNPFKLNKKDFSIKEIKESSVIEQAHLLLDA